MTAEAARRVRIVVSGRVQGVGFRYAAVTEARRLGLVGWARNTPEGDVELVADGARDVVQAFIDWCQHGPPSARVAAVQHRDEPRDDALGGFGVRW
jgi:acylphosphatase